MEHQDSDRIQNLFSLSPNMDADIVYGPNICVINALVDIADIDATEGYYILRLLGSESLSSSGCQESDALCDIPKPFISAGYTLFINRSFIDGLAWQAGIGTNFQFPKDSTCNNKMFYLVKTYQNEATSSQEGHNLIIHSLEIQIAITALRCFSPKIPAANDKRNINTAIEYIRQNYRENFSLTRLAQAANYSNYHFIRVFKSQTGKTPFDYLMDIRVEKAAEMLLDSKASITDICFACGFTNPSHFTTVFKRKKGVTPSCYQKVDR